MVIDRPPVNVLNIEAMEEMNRALAELAEDRGLKVLVIAAKGKGFSAGVDVADHTEDRVGMMLCQFHGLFSKLLSLEAATVASVHGFALGGGLELIILCDFIVAAEGTKFGQPEIKVGVFPPVSAVLLPRLIGDKWASEILLTGESIDARRAYELGLVNRVVPPDKLEEETEALVKRLMDKSPVVLRLTKKAMLAARGFDFESALLRVEDIYSKELMASHDAREGLTAFMEKRGPVWKGK